MIERGATKSECIADMVQSCALENGDVT